MSGKPMKRVVMRVQVLEIRRAPESKWSHVFTHEMRLHIEATGVEFAFPASGDVVERHRKLTPYTAELTLDMYPEERTE